MVSLCCLLAAASTVGARPPPTPEEIEARMERVADDAIDRMTGAEAVPTLRYDDLLEQQKAAHPDAKFEEIEIPASGLRLRAWLVSPPDTVKVRGTVLALHPWQSNRGFAVQQFGFLLDYGFRLFVPDARSNLFIGNGDAFSAYLREDMEDLTRVMTYLEKRPELGPFITYGCAWGAMKGILLAATHPKIAAVISDASTLHYGLIMVDFMNKMPPSVREDWDVINRYIEKVTGKLEERLGYDINQYDPRDAVGKLKGRPILFIHGSNDTFVPISLTEELFAAAEEPKAFLKGPNFSHCNGMQDDPGRYIPRVVVFLDRHVPKNAPAQAKKRKRRRRRR